MEYLSRKRTLIGFLGGVAGCLILPKFVASLPGISEPTSPILNYGSIWIPLLGGIIYIARGRPLSEFKYQFGLRFRYIDILWGLALGCILRAMSTSIVLLATGHFPMQPASLAESSHDGWWAVSDLIAPIFLAPLIEETFFRGIILRSVGDYPSNKGMSACAVIITSLGFATLHITEAETWTGAAQTGITTLIFALCSATLAKATRRLGGVFLTHVTFNALGIVGSFS